MQYLINHPGFDLERFAKALERNAQEAVFWERRKLEWVLEKAQSASTEQEKA